MTDLRPERLFLRELIPSAGILALNGTRGPVAHKRDGSLVTAKDKEVSGFIRTAIARKFPGDQICSEEDRPQESTGGRMWFVDPIDGTGAFAVGNPVATIIVSLAGESGEPLLSVVFNPRTGEYYEGVPAIGSARRFKVPSERGFGRYQELAVRRRGREKTLDVAGIAPCHAGKNVPYKLAGSGVLRHPDLPDVLLRPHFLPTGIAMAMLADGGLHGLYYPGVHEWDVAAALGLAAGAVGTDAKGRPLRFGGGTDAKGRPSRFGSGLHGAVFACDQRTHEDLLPLFNSLVHGPDLGLGPEHGLTY